jgi:2-polyprenyl-6-methoxyphenol hydroxylase-like FAD-dependent oxidoreductase
VNWKNQQPAKPNDYEVIIVGAGPVGLLLGNLLGRRQIKTLVIEQEIKRKEGSRAIGITPPSLQILSSLNLTSEFIRRGVKNSQAFIHGSKDMLGKVRFTALPAAFPFVLSIPQETVETILEDNLSKYCTVTLLRGEKALSAELTENQTKIRVLNIIDNKEEDCTAGFLCVCEGKNSILRNQLGIDFKGGKYRQTYLMADYADKTSLGRETHFFFTRRGMAESFPLPGGKRRWNVMTPKYIENPPPGFLESIVQLRTGFHLNESDRTAQSPFGVGHNLASVYYRQNVIFCGDVAHVMSPIGGLGMNTGFGDAEFCAGMLYRIIKRQESKAAYFPKYQKYRKQAAKIALRRAALFMRMGAVQGMIPSTIRNLLAACLIPVLEKYISACFAMLDIPFHNLEQVRVREKLLFKGDDFQEAEK